MSGTPTGCFDTQRLEHFLSEQLNEVDESSVLDHINQCESCQNALESIAANDVAWEELRTHLHGHKKASDHDTISLADRDRELDMKRLQEYLGPTDDPEMLGRLGSYEVCRLVGRGSTGIVVKAHEPRLNRFVAIKVLSPSFSCNGSARTRFEREGRSIAAVSHEHVVPIYAVAEYRDLPYIVMQYISGGSLHQRIEKQGPLDTCEVARLGMQIANGLAAAHAQGIVHRDVKPANVMLENNVDRAMVTDFGLARVADEAAMTHSGAIAGTPQYMSPEQAMGEAIDARSDLFSLGSVMYAACTGRAPFRSESVFGVIKRVCESEPRPIREINPKIEPWLAAFIDKLHAKNREDRFDSAEQVAGILANELAHAQSPTFVSTPDRPWYSKERRKAPSRIVPLTIGALMIVAVLVALMFNAGVFTLDNGGVGNNGGANNGAIKSSEKPEGVGEPGKLVTVEKEFAGGDIDGYTLYLPRSYDNNDDHYPVILFLSGGLGVGGPGVDVVNEQPIPRLLQKDHGPSSELGEILLDSFIVVTPHLVSGQFYNEEAAMKEILSEITETYRADPSRICLTGLSRGGTGTWGLASRMPDTFAAMAPLAGGLNGVTDLANLARMSIWIAHNTGDSTFQYSEINDAVRRIENEASERFLRITSQDTSSVDYMEHSRVIMAIDSNSHDSWTDTYENVDIYKWFLQQKKQTPPESLTDNPVAETSQDVETGAMDDVVEGVPGQLVTVEKTFSGGVVDGYTLYLPKSYERQAEEQFPVIMFLQGGLGVGGQVDVLNEWGLPGLLQQDHEDVPELNDYLRDTFIVVSPHIRSGQYFDHEQAINEILDEIMDTCHADPSRVYLTGLSRGGSGTWGLASRIPNRFAAIVPLAGRIDGVTDFEALSEMPVWTAHNTGDRVIDFDQTARAVMRLEGLGGDKFHRLDPANASPTDFQDHNRVLMALDVDQHDVWTETYRNIGVYKWMLQYRVPSE